MKLIAKIVRKFIKTIFVFFLAIIRIILIFYILIHSNLVQNYIIDYITNIISKELNTKVTISHVDIELFNKLVLEKVYVEDLQKDTLLFVDELKLALNDIDLKNNEVYLDKIILQKLYFNAYADTSRTFNYQFIIDALSSDNKDTSKAVWTVNCKNFELSSSKFRYKSRINEEINPGRINFSDLLLTNINLDVNEFSLLEDTIIFNIEKLNFIEKSGFIVENFHSSCNLITSQIYLSDIIIHTPNSKLNFEALSFSFNDFNDDFNDFVNKVKIDSRIISSQLGTTDLSYFTSGLKGFNQTVFFSGKVKGKINRLKIKDLELFYGDNTRIEGNISIDGLPEIENTFIHANINELSTNTSDLEKIPIPPFESNNTLELPSVVSKFGNILYSGKFTGFFSDFVAYGNFRTALGNIDSDISIKQHPEHNHILFTGNVKTENLNIGKLLDNEKDLGHLSLNAKIDGYTDLNGNNVKGKFDGMINSVDLLGYNYKNIELEGDIDNKMYDGLLKVNDPNIYMDFLGRFDFNDEVPVFDFTVDITNANLFKLNVDTIDSSSTISLFSTANFVGKKLDDIVGEIGVYNLSYTNKNGNIKLVKFDIVSKIENLKRDVKINSSLADANVYGEFKFSSLQNTYFKFVKRYMPALIPIEKEITNNESGDEFLFEVDLKDSKQIADIFFPDYLISDNTKITGYFNSKNDSLDLVFTADTATIKGVKFEDILANIQTHNNKLNIDFNSKRLVLKEDVFIKNIEVINTFSNNIHKLNISWNNRDSIEYSGKVFAQALFSKNTETSKPIIDIELSPSAIIIANDIWYINDCSFKIDSSFIEVSNLTFNKNEYYFYADGFISENPKDSLRLIFNEIELTNFSNLISSKALQINGKLNGEASLSNLYNNPMAIAQLSVDSLKFNSSVIGNMYISSKWDNTENKIDIDAYVKRGNLKTIAITGKYFTKAELLDIKFNLDKFKLDLLETFVSENVSNLRGLASGDVFLTGKFDNPILNGKISLQKTSFTIDYLKTRYNFTDFVYITKNKFSLESVKLYDEYGNEAIFNGSLTHNKFEDIKFTSTINLDNFLVLNTQEKDNELFYGRAFMSGSVNIIGNPENIAIEIDAKTEKYYHKLEKRTEYTKFNIPLSSGEEVEENNFITFINTTVESETEEKYKVDLSGIKMNFDLEVTPDAEVQIIFDSKVGDVVKARGNSNLKLEINTLGNFTINGEYVIDKGDYLFTLQNVINKRFDIEKGGYIKWDGDPYTAYINTNAIYRLKTSLYDLTLDTTMKNRVPVECHLKMENNLLTPDISFSVILPTANDEASSILNKMSADEINKQILSLLVLNRFYTPPSISGAVDMAERKGSGAVGVTSSELLSNQLSHWLSQISNDFDVGVNYRPGDELTKDELEVALSTQIFNDRVSLNGNVGVGGQNTSTSNVVGDFVVDVKLNKSGKLKLKGYNKANDNIVNEESPYTQGVGFLYKEDFDSWGSLMRRYFRNKNKAVVADTLSN